MSVRMMTWNMAWAYGAASDGISEGGSPNEGVTYRQQNQSFFLKNLAIISSLIRESALDIVFLQEVDFKASRSCNLNQLEFIRSHVDLPYCEHVVSWNHPYVPYPGLNPKNHFGKIISGGAILSRFPIKKVKNVLLPKPSSHSALKNWFYLSRYIQICDLQLPNHSTPFRIANLHLEAFDEQNRKIHLQRLRYLFSEFRLDLAAGDFNGKVDMGQNFQIIQETPTFPAGQPTQTLDAFVCNSETKLQLIPTKDYDISCSDHLPLVAEILNH